MKDAEKVIEVLTEKIKHLETDLMIASMQVENLKKQVEEKREQRPSTNKAEEQR